MTAPLVTFVFGLAGAYAVSRQVEATLFVGLQGDVTSVSTAQWVAHLAGAVTMVLTFFSATWRAAVLAFARARERCLALQARGAPVMADGLGSMLLAAPMVAVWLLNAQSLAALIVPGP